MVAAQYIQIRAGTSSGFTPVLYSPNLNICGIGGFPQSEFRQTGDLHREILFFLAGPLMSDL